MFKVGITGTRNGLTPEQLATVRSILAAYHEDGARELHHGDCVGADAQVAAIARELGYKIIGYPPVKTCNQAFFPSDESKEPADYLTRDRHIVDCVDTMIGCPKSPVEEFKRGGGTWYTIRYSRKAGREVVVVFPDGTMDPTSH